MDSQHKQELKENDLQQFLAHFGEWWGKHQTKVLLIAIVLAGSILGLRWMNASSAAKHDATYFDLNIETSPAGFKKIASEASSDSVRAIAALRAADLLLKEATMPADTGEEAITPKQREAKFEEASNLYKQVVTLNQNQLLTLNAKMGIASVAESLGNWDEASSMYETIKTEAGDNFKIFAQRADAKLAMLPRIKTSPVFAPEPKKPDPTKSGDSKTGDGKTNDGKTKDAKSGDAKAGDEKSGDTKSGDTKQPTKDGKSPAKPGDSGKSKTGDTKSGDTKSGDAKAGDDKAGKSGDAKDNEKSP